VSLAASAADIRRRITRRREEVLAVIDAANAHLVADQSKLDVLLSAGEKDIEEWFTLTSQLVDNAFSNAEENYLRLF
jgi:hypothetical protein